MTRPRADSDYHHGALREALLDAAFAKASSDGLEALTLRGLARGLNVSHPAAYRHFASKASLINAVADEGFTRLDAALASCEQADARAQFEALGRAYVGFAVAHRGVYRAMFRRETYEQSDTLSIPASAQAPFARVALSVARLVAEQERTDVDPQMMTVAIWSLMHGLALLWINGAMQLQTGAPSADAVAAPIAALVASLLCRGDDA